MKNVVIELRQGEIYFNKGLGNSKNMSDSGYNTYNKIVEIIRKPKRLLFLGGGGCTTPTYFFKKYPHTFIDIVEIDGIMIELAKKYCGLNNHRVTFYNQTARNFVNSCQNKYDLIFHDIAQGIRVDKKNAMSSIQKEKTYVIHEYFCTYTFECLTKINQLLNKNGVLIINVLGTLEKNHFWQYVHTSLKTLFLFVLVFPKYHTQIFKFQNIILLAGNSPFFKNIQTLQKAIYNSKLSAEDKFQMLALTANKYSYKKTGGTNLLFDRDFKKWRFQHTP